MLFSLLPNFWRRCLGGNGNPVKRVRVRAPASVANIGAGFDVLAMAIEGFFDEAEITISKGEGRINVSSAGFDVPSGRENIAHATAEEFLNRYGIKGVDVNITLHKGIPPSLGLGSSGASCVATVYALSHLFGIKLPLSEFLELAGLCECFTAGSPHYDNVAASALGGVVIVDCANKEAYRIIPPVDIHIALLIPEPIPRCERKTALARSILPKQVDLKTLVYQSSAVAKLVYAFMTGDLEILGKAASTDFVAEPKRSALIPFYWELKGFSLSNGALGFNIAGAGPSVFAICRSPEDSLAVADAMRKFASEKGLKADVVVTKIAREGVSIVK